MVGEPETFCNLSFGKMAIILGEDMDESSDTSDDSDEELSDTKSNATPKESRIETTIPSNLTYFLFLFEFQNTLIKILDLFLGKETNTSSRR
jgi:hypothetical protein